MANDDQAPVDANEDELVIPEIDGPALDELVEEDEDTPEDVLNSGQYLSLIHI